MPIRSRGHPKPESVFEVTAAGCSGKVVDLFRRVRYRFRRETLTSCRTRRGTGSTGAACRGAQALDDFDWGKFFVSGR